MRAGYAGYKQLGSEACKQTFSQAHYYCRRFKYLNLFWVMKQTNKEINRQTNKQKHRQTDIQTNIQPSSLLL